MNAFVQLPVVDSAPSEHATLRIPLAEHRANWRKSRRAADEGCRVEIVAPDGHVVMTYALNQYLPSLTDE